MQSAEAAVGTTSGAGDSLVAGTAAALLRGVPLPAALAHGIVRPPRTHARSTNVTPEHQAAIIKAASPSLPSSIFMHVLLCLAFPVVYQNAGSTRQSRICQH